jgi:3-methyladenine DNA glycosylase AlkD
MTASDLRAELLARSDARRIPALQRFFKTAPGDYAHGDVFIGVTVPHVRALCRSSGNVDIREVRRLLRSPVHEERLLALLLLVDAFRRGSDGERREIYDLYLASTRFINNWDLVDVSAHQIVGAWLNGRRSRAPLERLARSGSVWERRIAVIATFHEIKRGRFADIFRIADVLLADNHDLIHKAVGWMLREVGKRDAAAERGFLKSRYRHMPRTMLRYAIEKFPGPERRRYLTGTA